MSKVIGIICEGTTDRLAISELIDYITGEENEYRAIQPEPDCTGAFGNGWKGVYRWCEDNREKLGMIFDGLQPKMDCLIIHMDADVARKEKEIHCICNDKCNMRIPEKHVFVCDAIKDHNCPILLPCNHHEIGTKGYKDHIKDVIKRLLGENFDSRVIITAPCDSTDAWIVAGYDNIDEIEAIEDPWNSIISIGKYYHDIRVFGHKKNANVYRKLLEGMEGNWDLVFEKSESANELRNIFTQQFTIE